MSNFLALSTLQFLNILLPFITIPYLIITVGIDNVGKLNIAYALAVFSQMIIEYGFNTTTTRDIALLQGKKRMQDFIFSQVFYSKILLFLFCCLIQVILWFTIEDYKNNSLIYLLQFGVTAFQAMFPVWYFQGIQRMKYVTVLNAVFKILFTLCIFIFVKNENDFWKAPLYTCIGFGLSTISAYLLIVTKFKVSFFGFSIKEVIKQIRSSFYVFISDFLIGMIPNLNLLILGYLKGDYVAGIYSIAEKLIRSFSNLQLPLINAFFPYLVEKSNEKVKTRTTEYLLKYGITFILLVLIIMFVFTDYIYLLIFKKEIVESMLVFKILLLFPVFYFINLVLGKLVLLVSGKMITYFKIIITISILNLILCFSLTSSFSYVGTSISVVLVEFLISLSMIISLKYNKR